jgi:outer membrane immunogenic protein
MKKFLLGTVALVALGAAAPAMAADLAARPYTKAPAYAAPIYNWTGFYIGGHVGGAFAGDNSLTGNNGRFLGGVQGGFDYQFAQSWVFGVEAHYTWGPALLYAKGGYAWKDGNNLNVSTLGVPVAFTTNGNHRDGYTVGAGLEYMFAPSWSAKAEYQYYNFGSTTFTTGPAVIVGTRFRDDEHTVKAGINYRFNWGGPVVARY